VRVQRFHRLRRDTARPNKLRQAERQQEEQGLLRAKQTTSFSCRRRTRATRCITPMVLYTRADAQCDELATVDDTVDNTCDSRRAVQAKFFPKSKFSEHKVSSEVPLFWRYLNFHPASCRISRVYSVRAKMSSILSAVSIELRLVTDKRTTNITFTAIGKCTDVFRHAAIILV